MEFRVLGPLEVLEAGRPLPLGGAKQRAVLALLLLRANSLVHTDALVEAVWGELPPERSRAVLHVYLANLRKVLEPHRGRGSPSTRIATGAEGYRLRVGPDELDLDRFYRLTREARAPGADAGARSGQLAQALQLWRGPAFLDLAVAASPELTRLAEDHLVAVEERLDAELATGRHEQVVSELAELVAEHPLRERLRRQLVLALYRCGRQVEALETYRSARDELVVPQHSHALKVPCCRRVPEAWSGRGWNESHLRLVVAESAGGWVWRGVLRSCLCPSVRVRCR